MPNLHPAFYGKIANLNFALAALHSNEPHGEFKALVRFAQPEKRPTDARVVEIHSNGFARVRIRCDRIGPFIEDGNVLRVELSEYISDGLAENAAENLHQTLPQNENGYR